MPACDPALLRGFVGISFSQGAEWRRCFWPQRLPGRSRSGSRSSTAGSKLGTASVRRIYLRHVLAAADRLSPIGRCRYADNHHLGDCGRGGLPCEREDGKRRGHGVRSRGTCRWFGASGVGARNRGYLGYCLHLCLICGHVLEGQDLKRSPDGLAGSLWGWCCLPAVPAGRAATVHRVWLGNVYTAMHKVAGKMAVTRRNRLVGRRRSGFVTEQSERAREYPGPILCR